MKIESFTPYSIEDSRRLLYFSLKIDLSGRSFEKHVIKQNPNDLQSWIFLLFVYMNYLLHEGMQDFGFWGMSGSRFWLFSYSIPLSLSLCYLYISCFVYEFDTNISLNQWLMVWNLSLAILLLLIKFWRVFKRKISFGC